MLFDQSKVETRVRSLLFSIYSWLFPRKFSFQSPKLIPPCLSVNVQWKYWCFQPFKSLCTLSSVVGGLTSLMVFLYKAFSWNLVQNWQSGLKTLTAIVLKYVIHSTQADFFLEASDDCLIQCVLKSTDRNLFVWYRIMKPV